MTEVHKRKREQTKPNHVFEQEGVTLDISTVAKPVNTGNTILKNITLSD